MTHVYVVEAQDRLVKIGIAANPQSRLAQLRTGTPFPLRLAHVEDVEELIAARVEHMAHHRLAAHRTHGEWFAVSVDEAVQAIRSVSAEMRNPPGLARMRAAFKGMAVAGPPASIPQIRAARGLLGWSQTRLAEQAGLSLPTVKRYETASALRVSEEAVAAIQRALEAAGVEFTNGGEPGVKLRKNTGD